MQELVSPKQVARAIGASESSLKRWCDNGLLPTTRTAGGHRRIALNGVLKFIRDNGHQLVEPEVIGLPSAVGTGERTITRARETLLEAFTQGSESMALRCLLDLYIGGTEVTQIFDDVIAPAMADVGKKWAGGQMEIYEERRAVEFMTTTLMEIGRLLPAPGVDDGTAPVAMGGTLSGDPYSLGARMAVLTVRDAGVQSVFLGCGLPFETYHRAVELERPSLLWISVGAIEKPPEFISEANRLAARCKANDTLLAMGGRALGREVAGKLQSTAVCESMAELSRHVRSRLGD